MAYSFDLPTHCGIEFVVFGGRAWQATDPQPEPATLPDSHGVTSYSGDVAGTATLTDQSKRRFAVRDPGCAANGQTYTFTPAKNPIPLCA